MKQRFVYLLWWEGDGIFESSAFVQTPFVFFLSYLSYNNAIFRDEKTCQGINFFFGCLELAFNVLKLQCPETTLQFLYQME